MDQARIIRACELAHQAYTQGQYARGLQHIQAAAQASPQWFEVQNLYAILLEKTGQAAAAARILEYWCQQRPSDVGLRLNLAWCHLQAQAFAPALTQYQRILQQEPQLAPALQFAGLAASRLQQHELAVELWLRLAQIQPQDAQNLYNLGASYQELGQTAHARQFYLQALALAPSHLQAQMNFMFNEHYGFGGNPEQIYQLSCALGQSLGQQIQPYTHWLSPCQPHKAKLRIGLISADLHEHPIAYFLAGLLEHSPQDAVEWIAFSDYQAAPPSPWTQNLLGHFAAIHHTSALDDAQLAQHIHAQGIDILLDLTGWGRGHRLATYAHKPAPVQIATIGYFATTGLEAIDAIIADPSLPPEEETLFSETVWRMPHTRLAISLRPEILQQAVSPLPALRLGHITFGCFQNLNKLNDAVLAAWGQIAQRVPHAHWRIQAPQLDYPSSRQLLQQRLEAAGLPLQRLSLVGKQSFAQYLQSYAQVDILLDTFPYPGGTTTLEALYMGVPTLSLASPGMLGRQGQGLLQAAQLAPDWLCHSVQDYCDRASTWAQPAQWPALAALRLGLRQQLGYSPVFNTAAYAHDWLALVRQIWQHACVQAPWASCSGTHAPTPSAAKTEPT